MAWSPIEQPCDYVLLGGKRSPGVAEIVGASSPRQWDEREGFGLSGAWIIFRGRGLAKFSIVLHLLSQADWDAWTAWKPLVDKMPTRRAAGGKDSGALEIWHPHLEALDIKAVAVVEVMQPVQDDLGGWSVEIKLIEFRRPKVALAKPDGAAAGPEPDPIEENVIKPLVDMARGLL